MVMPDKDVIKDIDYSSEEAPKLVQVLVSWMVRQIDMLIRRKKAELLDKKPGGLYEGNPTIIFVRMIRRVDSYGESKNQQIYNLRAKVNDALNDAAARINQHILTINSCNTSSHYDLWGNLSNKGYRVLWYKIGDLLERFDQNAVKLLPNPNRRRFNKKPMSICEEPPECYFTICMEDPIANSPDDDHRMIQDICRVVPNQHCNFDF